MIPMATGRRVHTLRTLAQAYGLTIEALVLRLELTGEHDLDAPLRPRVAAVYRHVLDPGEGA